MPRVERRKKRIVMVKHALIPLIAALLVADAADGLGGVRVELDTAYVHFQPEQVHLSISGRKSHNFLSEIIIASRHSRNHKI